MKHTYKQAKKAMNNLINYFGYRKSDFYDDGEDIICINYYSNSRKPCSLDPLGQGWIEKK